MEMPPASAMDARSCNWSINCRNTKTMPEILGDTRTPATCLCSADGVFGSPALDYQLFQRDNQRTLQGKPHIGVGGSNGNVLIQQKKKNNSSKG